jgi:hypothetical protein
MVQKRKPKKPKAGHKAKRPVKNTDRFSLPIILKNTYFRPKKPKTYFLAIIALTLILLSAVYIFSISPANDYSVKKSSQSSLAVLFGYDSSSKIINIQTYDFDTAKIHTLQNWPDGISKAKASLDQSKIAYIKDGSIYISSSKNFEPVVANLGQDITDFIWADDNATIVYKDTKNQIYSYQTTLKTSNKLFESSEVNDNTALQYIDYSRKELYAQDNKNVLLVFDSKNGNLKYKLSTLPKSSLQNKFLTRDGFLYYTDQVGDLIGNSIYRSKIYRYSVDTQNTDEIYSSIGIESVATNTYSREPGSSITGLKFADNYLLFSVQHWNEQTSKTEIVKLNLNTKQSKTLYKDESTQLLESMPITEYNNMVLVQNACKTCANTIPKTTELSILENGKIQNLIRTQNSY